MMIHLFGEMDIDPDIDYDEQYKKMAHIAEHCGYLVEKRNVSHTVKVLRAYDNDETAYYDIEYWCESEWPPRTPGPMWRLTSIKKWACTRQWWQGKDFQHSYEEMKVAA